MNQPVKRKFPVFAKVACLLAITIMFAGGSALSQGAKEAPKKNAVVEAIVELKKVAPPKETNFRSRPKDAKEIDTADAALKLFGKDGLAALKKQVDFEKQKLVVMSWSGSGQDRIQVGVNESFPEQVVFSYKRGRTRDLRRHFKVYALRKNVRWSVGK
jgi:hypothetical protein